MIDLTSLPEGIRKKILWVDDDRRQNPLSHQPGGTLLIVLFHNGRVLGYDKVHYPSSYILTALLSETGKNITEIYSYVSSVYVKGEKMTSFAKAWSSDMKDISVIESLQKYDKSKKRSPYKINGSMFDFLEPPPEK